MCDGAVLKTKVSKAFLQQNDDAWYYSSSVGSSVEYELYWRWINIYATTIDVLLFMSHLWPNYWSQKVPLGTKWKIWTISFYWYLISPCGLSGLAAKASQSWAFFEMIKNAENGQFLQAVKSHDFGNFFSKLCCSKTNRDNGMKPKATWSLNYTNFSENISGIFVSPAVIAIF